MTHDIFPDILIYISQYLFNKEIAFAGCSCKLWYRVISSDGIWKERCLDIYKHRIKFFHSKLHNRLLFQNEYNKYRHYFQHLSSYNRKLKNYVSSVPPTIIASVGEGINCLSVLSEHSNHIAVGTFGTSSVKIYNIVEDSNYSVLCYEYRAHHGAVWKVVNLYTSLASGSFDGTVVVTDMGDGEFRLQSRLLGHSDRVMALEKLGDSPHTLISGSRDRTCRLWDVRTASQIGCIHIDSSCVYCVDSRHQLIALGTHNGAVHMYDMRNISGRQSSQTTGRGGATPTIASNRISNHPLMCMHMTTSSRDDTISVATGSKIGELSLVQLDGSFLEQILQYIPDSDFYAVRSLQIIDGGHHIISTHNNGMAKLYSTHNTDCLTSRYEIGISSYDTVLSIGQTLELVAQQKISKVQLTCVEAYGDTILCGGMEGLIQRWIFDQF